MNKFLEKFLGTPSKTCFIFRAVCYLNAVFDDLFDSDVSAFAEPKTGCSLGWVSVGWTLVILNLISFVVFPLTTLVSVTTGAVGIDILNFIMGNYVIMIGGFFGVLVIVFCWVIYAILTSIIFWSIVLVYLHLCLTHHLLRNNDMTIGDKNYNAHLSGEPWYGFLFRGYELTCFIAMTVYLWVKGKGGLKLPKWIRKIKLNCGELK